jgi:hypothetical protein
MGSTDVLFPYNNGKNIRLQKQKKEWHKATPLTQITSLSYKVISFHRIQLIRQARLRCEEVGCT